MLEVLSRLLGILLAAVGVQLFLDGLTTLGVIHAQPLAKGSAHPPRAARTTGVAGNCAFDAALP